MLFCSPGLSSCLRGRKVPSPRAKFQMLLTAIAPCVAWDRRRRRVSWRGGKGNIELSQSATIRQIRQMASSSSARLEDVAANISPSSSYYGSPDFQVAVEVEEIDPFSEPWEDSDLVLVVENERFHVHRQILSLHSPVFKAMLNTQFKEATSKEIPLPGKKATEILSFLKQLYLKERDGITLDKVDHLLKLADEYQVMSVFDLCVRCLRDESKSKKNAVRILYLANATVMAREDERLDIVRWKCTDLIENMELADIVGKTDFSNLDRDSLESVFRQKTERLETFLKRIYPQVIGLAEFCILLCMESSKSRSSIARCPQHFPSENKATVGLLGRIKSCPVCRRMIKQVVSSSLGGEPNEHRYGGNCHFDSNLISIIQDFENVIKSTTTPKTSLWPLRRHLK